MAGLPHFLNNRASTKYYEPMYISTFEVSILPPATVSGGEFLLEHVKAVKQLNTDKGSEPIEQTFKFAKRSYASGIPTSTVTDLAIDFNLNLNDANQLYVYQTLRNWWRLSYDPLTGRQGVKKDYVGTIVVSQYTRKGEIFWRRTFNECIPSGDLPALDGDYSSGEAQNFDGVTWRSDWFSESMA